MLFLTFFSLEFACSKNHVHIPVSVRSTWRCCSYGRIRTEIAPPGKCFTADYLWVQHGKIIPTTPFRLTLLPGVTGSGTNSTHRTRLSKAEAQQSSKQEPKSFYPGSLSTLLCKGSRTQEQGSDDGSTAPSPPPKGAGHQCRTGCKAVVQQRRNQDCVCEVTMNPSWHSHMLLRHQWTKFSAASRACFAEMGSSKLKHSFAVINCGHNGELLWTLMAQ